MMMDFYDILFFSGLAIVIGFFSSQLALALDSALDFGHWLDWFRMYEARTAANKVGMLEIFDKEVKEIKVIGDFGDRLDEMDKLYWRIASRYKPLTLWLCPFCMSHRINFFLSISIITAYSLLEMSFHPEILGFFLISFSINQIFITR